MAIDGSEPKPITCSRCTSWAGCSGARCSMLCGETQDELPGAREKGGPTREDGNTRANQIEAERSGGDAGREGGKSVQEHEGRQRYDGADREEEHRRTGRHPRRATEIARVDAELFAREHIERRIGIAQEFGDRNSTR